jgi:hypothetical protein
LSAGLHAAAAAVLTPAARAQFSTDAGTVELLPVAM